VLTLSRRTECSHHPAGHTVAIVFFAAIREISQSDFADPRPLYLVIGLAIRELEAAQWLSSKLME
jgi:hypothetical protein